MKREVTLFIRNGRCQCYLDREAFDLVDVAEKYEDNDGMPYWYKRTGKMMFMCIMKKRDTQPRQPGAPQNTTKPSYTKETQDGTRMY